jgi:hypothetical protein
MTRAELEALPEAMRPPRAWPLLVFTVVALMLAMAALYMAWTAVGQADATDNRSRSNALEIAHERDVRCQRQAVRLRVEPTTPVEKALRDLAVETYARDCD